MTDIAAIKWTPWDAIAKDMDAGQPIDSRRMIDAINQDEAISDSARRVLLAVANREPMFKTGVKAHWMTEQTGMSRRLLRDLLNETVRQRAEEIRKAGALRGGGGPVKQAQREIAEANGLSHSTLEKMLRCKNSRE